MTSFIHRVDEEEKVDVFPLSSLVKLFYFPLLGSTFYSELHCFIEC